MARQLGTHEDTMVVLRYKQERYVAEQKARDRAVAEKKALQREMEQEQERRRGEDAEGWEATVQGRLTDEEALKWFAKAIAKVAAEEEARQQGCRKERRRKERRRK